MGEYTNTVSKHNTAVKITFNYDNVSVLETPKF